MLIDFEQNELNFLVSILTGITIKASQPDAQVIAAFVAGILSKINNLKEETPIEEIPEM